MHQEGYVYRLMVWITRLAYLNILWVLFSSLGLLVFGIFPATTAMFAIERRWIRGNTSFSILPYFWEVYKREFKKANLIVLPFVLLSLLIYINLQFTLIMNEILGNILLLFLFSISFLLLLVLIYFFPVYVHYDIKLIQSMLFSFMIALSSPLQTILIIVNVLAFFIVSVFLPGIFFLFAGSVTSMITMWFAYRAIIGLENRNERLVRQ
ncbi:hypothetical protein JCM21714_3462 [Gracilibacillus boraciitolerans JCM 21714]|uniref:YESV protein n=1 Tax=Gracilibacillus boraciitolerans JCM 21714 TaxID=1298598 RepID=W4VLR0_9BACI|nr:DUF624 domain-containing protein [Gracilibacillus boraciitolerans]GAE94315.1 hypothetical protein JCM21714_3462 [Gracilibacillus boraciitolerans JCM 21714]